MYRIKSILTISLLLVLPFGLLPAQTWLEMWKNPEGHTFHDIQQAFYDYYETHDVKRGDGHKQFKRWEYYMESRAGEDGTVMNPQVKAFNNYLEYVQTRSFTEETERTASLGGDWTFFGSQDHIKGTTGYNGGIGRINVVAFHPTNASTIYAGAPAGGLWKTTNTGATWTPLTDGIDFWGVSGIVVHPTSTNTIYILTGDGDGSSSRSAGVWKTTNGGSTWSPTGLNINYETSTTDGYKLLMDPTNSNVLYAVMTNGLHKTTNGGTSWSVIRSGNFRDMEFKPGNSNTLYLSSTNTIYRSTNAGTTWSTAQTVSGANRIALGVSPANANYVYAFCGSSTGSGSFKGVYRSTNSGASFSLRGTTPNILGYSSSGSDNSSQSWYDLALAVNPNNANHIITGGVNVWESTDGGNNFSIQSYWIEGSASYEYTHADIHELVYNGNTLYCGSDGGVYRSTNNGGNWSDISSGLGITEFYRFGGTPQNVGLYVGGAQDNGSNKLTSPIPDLVMEHIDGADGMEAAVDPTNVNVVFTTRQYGSLWRSTNGGNTHSSITPSNLGGGPWVTPFILNPGNAQTILAAYNDVGVSYSQGGNWINLTSGSINGGTNKCLAIAESDTNRIYVVKTGKVWKSTNFGSNWTDITSGLPGGTYTYIAVSNTDANRIYVTRSTWTANSKIFMSTNGGSSWTNYSGTGLPNVPANCVVYEAGSDNGVYIGTDAGVYYRDDNLTDWVDFSNGLPFCRVMEMEINPLANRLRAATYGRSIWESDLYGSDCADDLVLSGPVSGTQTIEANNTITSTQSVQAGSNITYSAGTRITLNPGFTQASGSQFHAILDGCASGKIHAVPVTGTYEPPLIPEEAGVPVELEGFEVTNYPNPFRHHTWISYKLPEASPVRIEIYNQAAQRIMVLVDEQMQDAGTHSVFFEGARLPAGQYFARFTAGTHTSFQKLSQLK
ncbi:MAG: 3-coathanger stack domain-containing protein [Bacteroidota bacterium]